MNDKILQNIWNTLTSEGITTSDFDTWKSNVMASENIQENIHGYLTEKGLVTSDLQTWKTNTGLKKKDIGDVEEFLQKTSSEEPSVVTPPTYEVDEQGEIIIPEVLEEEVKKEKPSDLLSTEEKKKIDYAAIPLENKSEEKGENQMDLIETIEGNKNDE